MSFINQIVRLHHSVFDTIRNWGDGWLLGAAARLTFAAVLYGYFWNAGKTKIGEGLFGIFQIQDGAYFQVLGEAGMTAYEFDTANVPFYLDAVVAFGTWAEFILPILIVVGLFTRIAAAGMVVFVFVQSYVDVAIHKADAATVGMLFDRDSASTIMDQRMLWMLLFAVLIVKGAGALSLDTLVSRWWNGRQAG